MERPDVLVLGGGGLLGEAWLRALLAGLESETGWDLRECDAFLGTSAGSIVAAVLAAGRRPQAAADVAASWERAAAESARQNGAAAGSADGARPDGTGHGAADEAAHGLADGARHPLLGRLGRRAGGAALSVAAPLAPVAATVFEPAGAALRAAALRRGPRAAHEFPRLRSHVEQLRAEFDGRLRVTAVDLQSGRRVVFGAPGAPATSVAEAVLASCAVPWVFTPVTIGGRDYVDGGVWSAANLDAAPAGRGTEVLCLNPVASPRLAADRFGAMRAYAGASAAAEALVLRRRGARVRIVAPDAATVDAIGPSLFDGRRRAPVEAAAYAQGRALGSRA